MQELDRVLDRDHVLFVLVVDLVEHRGKRRRLTGTGRSRDEHEAAGFIAQTPHHRRQGQLVETLDFPRNRTEYSRDCAALMENVAAEACQALQAERKVKLP